MKYPRFKAWHKQEHKMYYVAGFDHIVDHDDYSEPEREMSEDIQHVLLSPELPYVEKIHRVDANDVELVQYTGLRDRNKKDGYQGDIVKLFERSLFCIVWDDHYARFQLELVEGKEVIRIFNMDMLQYSEIIDNICSWLYEAKEQ